MFGEHWMCRCYQQSMQPKSHNQEPTYWDTNLLMQVPNHTSGSAGAWWWTRSAGLNSKDLPLVFCSWLWATSLLFYRVALAGLESSEPGQKQYSKKKSHQSRNLVDVWRAWACHCKLHEFLLPLPTILAPIIAWASKMGCCSEQISSAWNNHGKSKRTGP